MSISQLLALNPLTDLRMTHALSDSWRRATTPQRINCNVQHRRADGVCRHVQVGENGSAVSTGGEGGTWGYGHPELLAGHRLVRHFSFAIEYSLVMFTDMFISGLKMLNLAATRSHAASA